MKLVPCQAITEAAFAPYGQLIQAGKGRVDLINDGSTERYSDLAALDLLSPGRNPALALYVSQARRFPLPITRLEQHRAASQTFMPLGPQRFIVVVAEGSGAPDWSTVVAFVTEPGQGVNLARGCWHHGLVALNDGDRFLVIDGGGYRSDTFEVEATEEIVLERPPTLLSQPLR